MLVGCSLSIAVIILAAISHNLQAYNVLHLSQTESESKGPRGET